jgi:sulfite reductase alpha subunit-like flavoprotein
MASAEVPKILVGFGSQTGCGQSIATQLVADLRPHVGSQGLHLSDLNSWCSNFEAFTQIEHVLIVCSTTGAGDAPDNADRFWRTLRKRTMKPDTLARVRYSVLALGDTNYDHFCQAGKRFHKRLKVGRVCVRACLIGRFRLNVAVVVDVLCCAGSNSLCTALRPPR